MTAPVTVTTGLDRGQAIRLFAVFAFAYFFSALVRAVTATLAPVFSKELDLAASQLGLLAGAYFLGFSVVQLPLGSALDRWGARRVLLVFLAAAVVGCIGFAAATDLTELLLARLLVGAGLGACLMAPLTSFRHRLTAAAQLQANAWLLMTGSFGMLASTLPVQWLLPLLGWRGLFVAVAGLLVLAMAMIAWVVPGDRPRFDGSAGHGAAADPAQVAEPGEPRLVPVPLGYRAVFSHPAFIRVAPLGFVAYGGLIAMQSLWIGPWLTEVTGRSADGAARGLFVVNLAMLLAFLCWGLVMPRLTRSAWAGERLIATLWPLAVLSGGLIAALGEQAPAGLWALWCVASSVVSLSQPALAQAFPAALAGRALSAFNLVIFAGVFVVQWCLGLLIDLLQASGLPKSQAFRLAFATFIVTTALSFLWLNLLCWRDARAGQPPGAP